MYNTPGIIGLTIKTTGVSMKWTEDEIQFLLNNHDKMTLKQISKILNRNYKNTTKLARKLGINKHPGLSEEKEKILVENYPTKSIKWLIQHTGLSKNYIDSYAGYHNLHKTVNTRHNNKLEKLLDTNSFESLYWLGFFVADGHITNQGEFSLSQSEKDKDQVYKLATFMEGKVTIRNFEDKNGWNKTTMYVVTACSKEYGLKIRELIGLSLTDKKTYTKIKIDFLNTPEKAMCFLAGFSDGDGYIREDQIAIQCHKSYLEVFNNLITILPPIFQDSKLLQKKGTTTKDLYAQWYIRSKPSRFLYQFVIQHNLPINKRKWKPIKDWLETH